MSDHSKVIENLVEYNHVSEDVLVNAGNSYGQAPTGFGASELLHFSRLITIGELCACFAHEVTNPLMLIRGHLKIVEEGLPSEDLLQTHLAVIDRASRRIDEMAKRMLDFSKKRAAAKETADITEVVSDALRFIQPYIRAQFIEVQVHLAPEIPLVRMDRWQMVQAVVNVVQNAADAMSGLKRRILSIAACVEGAQLQIAISDTGPGISAANIEKIFDPFFTTKGERGTGLGLHITKQVIEEHCGTIQVETGECGTSFVISLPL
jgi:two-component system, NtrC family, sensor kinase